MNPGKENTALNWMKAVKKMVDEIPDPIKFCHFCGHESPHLYLGRGGGRICELCLVNGLHWLKQQVTPPKKNDIS